MAEFNTAGFNAAGFNAAERDEAERDEAELDVTEQDQDAERDVTWLDAADEDPADEDPAAEDLPTVNPAEPAEPTGPAIGVVPAGDTQSPPRATASTGTTSTGITSTGLNGNDDRWHDIVAGFIDDPRGSVAEAADLVEAEVTSLIALLSRRRDTLGETWQAEQASEAGSATEDLRLAIRGYREFSSQLAASVNALS
ncbi:MAG TPA: hypothetical protein VGM14_21315 [Streptosporangiaceae bacterium]|jgi:hypothetical protein